MTTKTATPSGNDDLEYLKILTEFTSMVFEFVKQKNLEDELLRFTAKKFPVLQRRMILWADSSSLVANLKEAQEV